jgi:hypothetical protein
MTYDLSRFGLGDMLKSSLRLREASAGASTLEMSAQRVCRFLYDELRDPGSARACALVRCYMTRPFGSLDPELQQFAARLMDGGKPDASM